MVAYNSGVCGIGADATHTVELEKQVFQPQGDEAVINGAKVNGAYGNRYSLGTGSFQ